jgi:hypothetical protein
MYTHLFTQTTQHMHTVSGINCVESILQEDVCTPVGDISALFLKRSLYSHSKFIQIKKLKILLLPPPLLGIFTSYKKPVWCPSLA